MTPNAEIINNIAKIINAQNYLEIGVWKGSTFKDINIKNKTAVDPNFLFDIAEYENNNTRFFSGTSDEFFLNHINKSDFATGQSKFDIIFIDGLHTYEQSYRDFINSFSLSHAKTIWLMDDTLPCDPWSAIPDQKRSYYYRELAGIPKHPWHGDVYKTIFAIHDFHKDFSYVTLVDAKNPVTVLWHTQNLSRRINLLQDLSLITNLSYFDLLDKRDIINPNFIGNLCDLLYKNDDDIIFDNKDIIKYMVKNIIN